MSMKELGKEIIEINTGNGWNVMTPEHWNDEYRVPAVLSLVHTEVSEAVEAFRKDDKDNFVEELADIVIRVLDISESLGMDIETAIREKLAFNRTRGHKHGGKRI